MSEFTIIFIPGLGCDHRLFEKQAAVFPKSVALDWIEPEKNEKLEDYAVRLAQTIPPIEGPILVCGLSLGGMIAPYVARAIGAKDVLLLCTVRNSKEFTRRYRSGWKLAKACPPLLWMYAFPTQIGGGVLSLLLPKKSSRRTVMRQIFQIKTRIFVRLTRMMLDWAYNDEPEDENDETDLRILQVHGTRDPLLPIEATRPDIRIEGGGHLLCLSHSDEINEIIRNIVQKTMCIE